MIWIFIIFIIFLFLVGLFVILLVRLVCRICWRFYSNEFFIFCGLFFIVVFGVSKMRLEKVKNPVILQTKSTNLAHLHFSQQIRI